MKNISASDIYVPEIKEGYVNIKHLKTGKIENIQNQSFIKRISKGELKDILVTDRLRPTGKLILGKTSYGEQYLVCRSPDYANKTIQYILKDGIATGIIFNPRELPLKIHKLAIVKDLSGKPVDSFLADNMLPLRVESAVACGMVGSIENLPVGSDNMVSFSSYLTFNFAEKGNFEGRELTAYYWGKARPLQFSFKGNSGRYLDINAGDVFIASEKSNSGISSFKRQEIKEAFIDAMQEIPLKMRPLATEVIIDSTRFLTKDGLDELLLGEHFKLKEGEFDELVYWFSKSESLKKILNHYGSSRISKVMGESIKKRRLNIRPLEIPGPGSVLVRDLFTDKIETIKRTELIVRYRNKQLNNKEILYDRLNSRGEYVLSNHVMEGNRRPNLLQMYTNFPEQHVRYIVRNGKIDRATLILLDEDGYPLENDRLKYAINGNTGELACHLPEMTHKDLRELLDNVIIYGRLNSKGQAYFGRTESGVSICVASFSDKKHKDRRVRYRVANGVADRTTVVLLNKDGTVYRDPDTRFAVVPGSDDIRCHLPASIFDDLRRQLDGMTIYDNLGDKGIVRFGKNETDGNKVCVFSKFPKTRIKYKVRHGKIDRTTILLLNKNGTVLEDNNIRYAVDPATGKIRCHLPDVVQKDFTGKLSGMVIYSRLSKQGKGSFAEGHVECGYARFKNKKQRYRFIVTDGKMDKTTIMLLKEDGTVLKDDSIRYVVDPETGKTRCHLSDYLSSIMRLKLEGMVIFDRLTGDGRILLGPEKDQCKFKGHPNRSVKYKLHNGRIDRSTLILLDDNKNPLDDGKTMYAVDMGTGKIKFHLSKGGITKDLSGLLDNVEILNARLDTINGILTLKGLTRYKYKLLRGHKIRYRILNNTIISISIHDKNNEIIHEEILDEELDSESFPKESDIRYTEFPEGRRLISYKKFCGKIYYQYKSGETDPVLERDKRSLVQKRLYELLHKNVYFNFGDVLRPDLQLKLKSQVFRAWLDIERSEPKEVWEKLWAIKRLFREYCRIVSAEIADGAPKKTHEQMITEINFHKNVMIEGGKKHGKELDLLKERIYKTSRTSAKKPYKKRTPVRAVISSK